MAARTPFEIPTLVVFGGKPGVGKSTIAAALALEIGATYLKIDAIEAPLFASRRVTDSVGPLGYAIAYQLAESNLSLGHTVIADCVNPIPVTRHAWASVAQGADAMLFRVEVACTDPDEHCRRVEERLRQAPGQNLPDWAAVQNRRVDPWPEAEVHLDTALMSPGACVATILRHLEPLRTGARLQ